MVEKRRKSTISKRKYAPFKDVIILNSNISAETHKNGSEEMDNSRMMKQSEILSKVGSRMFSNRSKAENQKNGSKEMEHSKMKKQSEILSKIGSRMFSSRSKVFHKNASMARIRKSSMGLTSEIPTSGTALLEWTRNNMSFLSTSDISVAEDNTTVEESELWFPVPPEDKKLVKMQEEKEMIKILHKRQYGKKKKLRKSVAPQIEPEVIDNTNIIRALEDEIMTRFRKKREEETLRDRAAATKSEVAISEPDITKSRKRKSSKPKTVHKKKKKSAAQLRLMEQRKAAEEEAAQAEKKEMIEQLLLKRAQDVEEEKMGEERNLLFMQNVQKIDEGYLNTILENERIEEWIHYSTCDKLPQVRKLNQLTFFIHKWELEFDKMSIQDIAETTGINLELLSKLEELIYQTPVDDHETLDKLNWAINILREVQWTVLEKIVYRIMSDVYDNMTIHDLDNATFQHKSNNFTLSLWLKLDWPISLPNPKKPAPAPIEIRLSEVDMDITLPASLNERRIALMCFHLPYDHMSDSCSTYSIPPNPEFVTTDILETNKRDRLVKNKYEYESYLRSQYIDKLLEFQTKHGNEKYPVQFDLPEVQLDEKIPKVPVQNLSPTADEYVDLAEELHYERSFWNNTTYVEQDEVNLRKFHIVGGVFNINLVYHPPQRQELVLFHMTLRTVSKSKELEYVPFHADFPSYPLHLPKHRESLDASVSTRQFAKGRKSIGRGSKRGGGTKVEYAVDPVELQIMKEIQENWEKEREMKKENLILISLRLPRGVVYLEKPTVCKWNENLKRWDTGNIHNEVYDDKEKRITFNSADFGIFGLAVRKHSNFPYRYWDIRPVSEDSIAVTLGGAKVGIHLSICQTNIEITYFQKLSKDCDVDSLDWMLSKVMTFHNLVQNLRSSGLDLFPEYDANCYYNDTHEKHWAMSYTTYYSMAMMAAIYNFSSSKWNSKSSMRSIVLKIREFNPFEDMNLLQPYQLFHITPSRCETILCTEDDDFFSNTPPEFSKFQPNLFYLLKSMVGATNRARLKKFSPTTYHTLAQFLVSTRLLSFS